MIIKYANIIEAIEYLKQDSSTTFEYPLSYTPIMINMLTEEEKVFLKSFKHLKYNDKQVVVNKTRNKLKNIK
jgi:hypothetical protein